MQCIYIRLENLSKKRSEKTKNSKNVVGKSKTRPHVDASLVSNIVAWFVILFLLLEHCIFPRRKEKKTARIILRIHDLHLWFQVTWRWRPRSKKKGIKLQAFLFVHIWSVKRALTLSNSTWGHITYTEWCFSNFQSIPFMD